MDERKSLLEENDFLSDKLNTLNRGYDGIEGDLINLNNGFNQSLNEITKLE